ncbi:lipoyl synthase [Cognatiluteimonas weifangensis]|uniref:Lipoyl synthase n=1 Tax=Cognatiluteimonas weifangensis TaxID=2303539 RepID=A0A372DIL6_9GAMM|nr:lipoyl synthase [Luteimonas weifangensis]RFP59421.1 lipoyl synthase [Luteimonas weifangensis]
MSNSSTSRPASGSKIVSPQGTPAVLDGIKPNALSQIPDVGPKPPWLRVRLPNGAKYREVMDIVTSHKLSTVCAESKCPNIAECWERGTATLMLMGSVCTRACKFCSVNTGNPNGWLDPLEPAHVADAVRLMGLKYVVLTSVDRDDLPDLGAGHYAACIRAIHLTMPDTAVEALTPDFQGKHALVAQVLDAGLATFAQNLETVKRLTHPVRDPRAGYEQTLDVLKFAKQHDPKVITKTSLMLGLGETDDEIAQALDDMRAADVDVVTMGQYMRPTRNHLPVERFVSPEQFREYRELALSKGFLEAVSGPLVRSSYRAERVLEQDNVGLDEGKQKVLDAIRESATTMQSLRC